MNDIPIEGEQVLREYDELSERAFALSISGLKEADIEHLIAYEKAHRNRLPVMEILEKRLSNLQGGSFPRSPHAPRLFQATPPPVNSPREAHVPGRAIYPPKEGDPTDRALPT